MEFWEKQTLGLLCQAAKDGNVSDMSSRLDRLENDAQRIINLLDEDELSPLHYAARYNFYEMIVYLVERGADVNIKGENGNTPLHFAARYEKIETNPLHAIAEDSGVQRETEDNETKATNPLLFRVVQNTDQKFETAVHQNQEKFCIEMSEFSNYGLNSEEFTPGYSVSNSIILYLALKGASINAEDNAGLTPLHYSAMRGNEVAAKHLLMYSGIDLEARDRQWMTPLHTAAIHNSTEVVRLLIAAGADLRCKDSTDATPLHHASGKGNIDIVNLILEAAVKSGGQKRVFQMVTDTDFYENMPLHFAIENENVDVVELLIRKGADTNAVRRHNSDSPLHLAAVSGNDKIVQLLLENKAEVNSLNTLLNTPLHRAADNNHASVIEILLSAGAEIEERNKDNFTPLLIAASKGHVEAIQCLLNRGVTKMTVDKNYKTPLYWAVEANSYEALVTLTVDERGKELLDRTDQHGNSPLHIAAVKGNLPIVQYLLHQGAITDQRNEERKTPLHLAAKEGKTQIVKELLSFKKHLVNNVDEDSNTPLHLAALAGEYNVIKILLEFGANSELRNVNHRTALEYACDKGWSRSVKVLLEGGSVIEPSFEIKTTPMHIAAKRGHAKIVELLMTCRRLVERKDAKGRNALELAIEYGHKSVATTIIHSDKWAEALDNYSVCPKTRAAKTILPQLIVKLPDVAEKVLNKCITTTSTLPSDHPDFEVTFDYQFIDDRHFFRERQSYRLSNIPKFWMPKSSPLLKEKLPLMIMVNSKRKQLLGHPLCMSLVRYKWLKYGRYVYYTNLAFYAFFLTFLTGYLLTTPQPEMELSNHSVTNSSQLSCEELKNQIEFAHQSVFAAYAKVIVMVLCSLMLLKEFFQVFQLRRRYLTFESLFEWLCYVSALLLVIDVDCFSAASGQRKLWQWELGAFSIFLAWVGLLVFIRKFSFLGLYVVMLTDVSITFVKVFAVFLLLVIGFSLSFNTMFYNQEAMLTPSKTLLRTLTMMLGEFNFDEMFEEDKVMFPAPSYIIFTTFIILMTIITMNLLVGLAVDDIKDVQEQAEFTRLVMRVELVLDVESIMPEFLRHKFTVIRQHIKINQSCHKYAKHLLSDWQVTATGSSKSVTKHESAETEKRHEAIISRITQIEQSVQHLQTEMQRFQNVNQTESQRLQSMMLNLTKDRGLPV